MENSPNYVPVIRPASEWTPPPQYRRPTLAQRTVSTVKSLGTRLAKVLMHTVSGLGLFIFLMYLDNGGPNTPLWVYAVCVAMFSPWIYFVLRALPNLFRRAEEPEVVYPEIIWDARTCQHCHTNQSHGHRLCIRCGRVLAVGASGQATR